MTASNDQSGGADIFNLEFPGNSTEQEIADFFGSGHPDDATVWVYELGGRAEKERSYLYSYPFSERLPPNEFFEEVLERYGYGRYQADLKKAGGQFIKRMQFVLGSERQRRQARAAELQPNTAPAAAPPAQPALPAPAPRSDELPPTLALILEGQNQLIQTLIGALARPEPAAQSQTSTLEVIRELAGLKDLFGGGGESQKLPAVITMMRELFALRDELGGGGGEGSAFSTAARALAGPLSKALDRLGDAPPAGAQPQPQPQPQPRPSEGTPMFMADWLKPLVQLAEARTPPPDAARVVLQELSKQPPAIEEIVLTWIDDGPEKTRTRVLSIAPQLAQHTEWLDQVIAEVSRLTEAPDTDEPAASDKDSAAAANS